MALLTGRAAMASLAFAVLSCSSLVVACSGSGGVAERSASSTTAAPRAPKTELEQAVEWLGRDGVSYVDDFIKAGGDSLSAYPKVNLSDQGASLQAWARYQDLAGTLAGQAHKLGLVLSRPGVPSGFAIEVQTAADGLPALERAAIAVSSCGLFSECLDELGVLISAQSRSADLVRSLAFLAPAEAKFGRPR